MPPTRSDTQISLERRATKRSRNLGGAAKDAAALTEWNSRKWVWVPDEKEGYIQGYVVKDEGDRSTVALESGELIQNIPTLDLERVNPPSYDGSEDIAELTYLNEASVVHNLRYRYLENDIYTYSGLFLVAINPYRPLGIYTPAMIEAYKHKRPDENAPHIYAVAEKAWQAMLAHRDQSQSVLVTGESGAGKTENTKKVIQYLAAIAADSQSSPSDLSRQTSIQRQVRIEDKLASTSGKQLGHLEQQILQANPILEAFGNAQTIKNDNSSRFGKFVRIFFEPTGGIAGANIDWYLLEKSRVTGRSALERNFHIFYQLLNGADSALKSRLLLEGVAKDFAYLQGKSEVVAMDDRAEWKATTAALTTVGFTAEDQFDLLRIISVVLHLGNIKVDGAEKAFIRDPAQLEKVCFLLGLQDTSDLLNALVRPKVKAGKEWVVQSRTSKQVVDELAALAKAMYEKSFGAMVDRINKALGRPSTKTFIGVLDIAGFEIFDVNGFEQLCINFTNEKLQQFFNHHMFVVEQEEYEREEITWDKVNFGLELQPTIDLIESTNPVGILAALDDACLMPKANDEIFTSKMHQLAKSTSNAGPYSKYSASRFDQGFTVSHYAGKVEYRTSGWIDSNRDPLSESVSSLLATSSIPYISGLFSEDAESEPSSDGPRTRIRRGAFRTVGQRHKERLSALMGQLSQTSPHFVRCIVPNTTKSPLLLDSPLVLDQLRCNGVLEGIRIARLGYPNRLPFSDFRRRFELITPGILPKGFLDGGQACTQMLTALKLDPRSFKVGLSKVFFKAGILAELEERRDNELSAIMTKVQASCRRFTARRQANKILNRAAAVRMIQRNARTYIALRDWPWWPLFQKIRPLLAAARNDDEVRKKEEELIASRERAEAAAIEREKLEKIQAVLEAEKYRIEVELENERSATRQSEALLVQSKEREAALEEDCQLMQDDIATLDDQLARAMASLLSSDERIVDLNEAFANSTRLVATLEQEQVDWKAKEALLASQTSVKTEEWERLISERDTSTASAKTLQRELVEARQDRQREQERLSTSIKSLEQSLAREGKGSKEASVKLQELENELKVAREGIQKITKDKRAMEDELKAAKSEAARARSEQQSLIDERDRAVTKSRDLEQGLASAASDLTGTKRLLEDSRDSYRKADADLRALRDVVAANTTDRQRQVEVDRIRDAELQNLRSKVASTESLLTKFQQEAATASSKLSRDLDTARVKESTTASQLSEAIRKEKASSSRLMDLQTSHDALEQQTQAHGLNLELVRTEAADSTLRERRKWEVEMSALRSKFSAVEDSALQARREKEAAERDGQAFKIMLEEEQNAALDRQNASKALEAKLDQQYLVLADLDKINGSLRSEMAAIKARLRVAEDKAGRTVVEHVRVLEEAQRLQNADMDRMRSDRDQRDAYVRTLERAKVSLIQTVEDLQHERESERRQAWANKPAVDTSSARLGDALESEKKLRQLAELNVARLQSEINRQQKSLDTLMQENSTLRRANTSFERELNTIAASDHNEHITLPPTRGHTARTQSVSSIRAPAYIPPSTKADSNQPPLLPQGSRRRNYE